jgi:hypothetical protein
MRLSSSAGNVAANVSVAARTSSSRSPKARAMWDWTLLAGADEHEGAVSPVFGRRL